MQEKNKYKSSLERHIFRERGNAMEKLIKTISVADGELYVISAGRRYLVARFDGRIEIVEKTNLVPILGTVQKGTKTIYASFIVCGDLEYQQEQNSSLIHSGKVYEAVAYVENEKTIFAGLQFEDSNPIENELVFHITDLELIQKLLK